MAVWSAAEATLGTLRELGLVKVCFIGSLAAKLYGNDREPNVSAGCMRNAGIILSANSWSSI